MDRTHTLKFGLEHHIFWITKRIAIGRYATHERAVALCNQGITHVLNVGEAQSVIATPEYGFDSVVDVPIVDLQLIPTDVAVVAMDTLHRMLSSRDSKVFIHCIAGQYRSPTILWLYFIACGLSPTDASSLIVDHSPDSVPGHGHLVDKSLLAIAKQHGTSNYLPLLDPLILEPAY